MAHPSNLLTDYAPWLKTEYPGVIFILPVVCWIFALILSYDAQPIPDEYIAPPEPLKLQQNDAWRRPTGFRFLEKCKEGFFKLEKDIFAAHKAVVEAHRRLPNSSGMLEYKSNRRTITQNLEAIEEWRDELEKQRNQIVRIATGDVRAEVLEIEEEIERAQRLREKYENEARQAEWQISNGRNKSTRGYYQNERESLGNWIHAVDTDLIKLRSSLKELREFDFKRLYGELGVSAEAMRTTEADLQAIQKKAQLVTAIRPPQPPVVPPPPPRPDPAKERAKKQAAIQAELERLEKEKQRMMATTNDEEMRRRIENMYNNKRAEVLEELRRYL